MEKPVIKQREIFLANALHMREAGEGAGTIEGVAIVTNAETVLYETAEFREVEVIDPSCLDADFLAKQDITLNLLHERNASIARTPNSLRYDVREDGLHFEADIPDCDLGKRAKALIENGTYTGCSFEFYAKDYEVSERTGADGKTEYVIRHKAFEAVTALTVAMNPAYEQTSVKAREIYKQEHSDAVNTDPAEDDAREAREIAARREMERRAREITAIACKARVAQY